MVGREFPDRKLNPGAVVERRKFKFLNYVGAGFSFVIANSESGSLPEIGV